MSWFEKIAIVLLVGILGKIPTPHQHITQLITRSALKLYILMSIILY